MNNQTNIKINQPKLDSSLTGNHKSKLLFNQMTDKRKADFVKQLKREQRDK